MSSTFTSDFRQEFEQERERWLRRRLLWYFGVTIALSVIAIASGAVSLALAGAKPGSPPGATRLLQLSSGLGLLASATGLLAYAWAIRRVYAARHLRREQAIRLVVWLFVVNGALGLVSVIGGFEVGKMIDREQQTAMREPSSAEAAEAEGRGDAVGRVIDESPGAAEDAENPRRGRAFMTKPQALAAGLGGLFVSHFMMCLFLPLSPRESFRPIAPLIAMNLGVAAVYFPGAGWFVALALLSVLTGVPGAAVCYWRQSRFQDKFHFKALRRRYGEMRQELTDARKIHEALFAQPVLEGPVRMDYRYEPMRQIGGDYLFSKFSPSPHGPLPTLSVVLMDVTGHGIPAALTVNRLHGELERLFAEHPAASPGFILHALNRYVHLTLASHSVYVTALCVRVDPNATVGLDGKTWPGVLEWASGGHPPAFLCAVDGSIQSLDSTAFVLGACHGDDFQSDEQCGPFGAGDRLIMYTDGAIEARNREGRMLRIEGFQRVVAGLRPRAGQSLAPEIVHAVEQFRYGPPADDTLVVEVSRPLPG